MKMSRIIWYLKQLFPLMYVSEYTANGKKELCIWRMWFGRCFDERRYKLAE